MTLLSAERSRHPSALGGSGFSVVYNPAVPNFIGAQISGVHVDELSASTFPSQIVIFVRRGVGRFFCRDRVIDVRTGDILVVRRFEVWGYQFDSGPRMRTGKIRLPENLDTLLPPRADGKRWPDLLPPDVAVLHIPGPAGAFASLVRRVFERPALDAALALIGEIVDFVDRHRHLADIAIPRPPAPPRFVLAIQAMMDGELPARLNLRRLAVEHGISVPHLIDTFHDHVGVTPHQFLLCRRLTVGYVALTTSRTVSEAIEAGAFADQAHFIRVFKKKTGLTPGRLLEWQRNGDRVVSRRRGAASR